MIYNFMQIVFRTSWLGIESFVYPTFVQVVDISITEYEKVAQTLEIFWPKSITRPARWPLHGCPAGNWRHGHHVRSPSG